MHAMLSTQIIYKVSQTMKKHAANAQTSPACYGIQAPYHLRALELGWMTSSDLRTQG